MLGPATSETIDSGSVRYPIWRYSLLSYRIDGPILEITTEGATSADEYRTLLETALEDPNLPHKPFLLSDSALASGEASAKDVAEMALVTLRLRDRFAPFKAVVATRSLIYGLARLYERRLDIDGAGVECRVFSTTSDAKAWLLSKVPAAPV